jgi:hypothetical protein
MVIDDSRANPVEVEADAGVITMVATIEAIDVTNRVVTLVGPNNNWVEVIVGTRQDQGDQAQGEDHRQLSG